MSRITRVMFFLMVRTRADDRSSTFWFGLLGQPAAFSSEVYGR